MIILIILILASTVYAGQEYNPYTAQWETVNSNLENTIQYNPYNSSWSYQPEDADIEYNPYSSNWEWDSGYQTYEEDE